MTVDLAREAAFKLGEVEVRPATREVASSSRSEIIEPRVMQVLVTLGRRRGEVVSRDELIAACWGGRVVGEDAINRCIGAIRRLAESYGGIDVHTVPRVGYRLSVDGAETAAGQPPEPVLAVLAFDNLSGDPEMNYFSDGVSEEILLTVACGADLKVIGRGSSFQFRGPDKAAAHVAQALRATHVLDGSVRRSGGKVRIAANLIECASETTLWSDRFDRELTDVFALQDEIAAAVADALKVAFSSKSQAETIDPGAYSRYLRALDVRNLGLDTDSRRTVIDLLEEALQLAPQFARAWVFLATMRAEQFRFDDPESDNAQLRAKVVAAAQTALAIDPSLGGVFQVLGALEPPGLFAQRESFHRRALALAGADPTVLTHASLFYAEVGFVSRAVELAARAYELDPLYPWVANWYAATLELGDRYQEARALYEACHRLWPENELIAHSAIRCAAKTDQWDWCDQLVQDGDARGLSGVTYRNTVSYTRALRASAGGGWLEAAQREFARRGEVSARTIVELYRLGFAEQAFDLIERASFDYMASSEGRSPNGALTPAVMFIAKAAPGFMEDRRFVRLCAKLGLAQYWLETDRWPDCADKVPYDFRAEARNAAAEAGRVRLPR
jgi:TolB-like protein